MGEDHLGEWTARFGKQAAEGSVVPVGDSKWHKIESDIADRKVVKCGKQLRQRTTSGELQFRKDTPPPFFCCKPCSN